MFSIYLVCSEIGGQKLHKIGFTRRTPEKRIKEFKTGNASEIYLVDSFQSEWGTKIEAMLHKIYKSKKVEGEWFNLDEDENYLNDNYSETQFGKYTTINKKANNIAIQKQLSNSITKNQDTYKP